MYIYQLSIYLIQLFLGSVGPQFCSGNHTQHECHHGLRAEFIQNLGQWDSQDLYRLKGGGVTMALQSTGIRYSQISAQDLKARSKYYHTNRQDRVDGIMHGHNYFAHFVGCNDDALLQADSKSKHYYNYFIGSDPERWASAVHSYESVRYDNLYDGIDMQMYLKDEGVKYDFIIEPGANANDIKINYSYVDSVRIKNQDLYVYHTIGHLKETRPFAYQIINGKIVEVKCEYIILQDETVGFHFPEAYDSSLELIIDPSLVFSSFLGSTDESYGVGASYDSERHLYGASQAFGNIPITPGAFEMNFSGYVMAGITKFEPDGTDLIYSTYLGGSNDDFPISMIANDQDEMYIMGITYSNDFPTLANSYQSGFGGESDAYIVRFSQDGTQLLASTLLGGSGVDAFSFINSINYADDQRGEVQLDSQGDVIVVSCTQSIDFPVTAGAFDTDMNGYLSGVVCKLTPDLDDLIWSSYLGGSGDDACYAVTLSEDDDIFVCGLTTDGSFPATAGAMNTTFSGPTDGFVSKISADGTSLLASTFVGAPGRDIAYFVELDRDGDVYCVGQNEDANYPIVETNYLNPTGNSFLQKMDPDLSTSEWSTRLGNGMTDWVHSAFLVDNCKRIYICGWSQDFSNSPMPISPDAIQSTTDFEDFYIMVLTEDAQDLEFGSYFGSPSVWEHVDGGTSRFDPRGIIYQAVCTNAFDDFPTSPDAYQTENQTGAYYGYSNYDLVVFKIDLELEFLNVEALASPSTSGCVPLTVDFNNRSTNADLYDWDFGDGGTSDQKSPTYTFDEVGEYTVRLIALDTTGCLPRDTIFLDISVLPADQPSFTEITICDGEIQELSSQAPEYDTIIWSTGDMGPDITVNRDGLYWVSATNTLGCEQIDSFLVSIAESEINFSDSSICDGEELILRSSRPDGDSFTWSTSEVTADITVNAGGVYWVETAIGECSVIDSFQVSVTDQPSSRTTVDACQETGATLTSSNQGALVTYTWNTGSSDPELNTDSSGLYWVIALDGGCTTIDSFDVNIIRTVPDSTEIRSCMTSVELTSSIDDPDASYMWSTGEITRQITVDTNGIYEVLVIGAGCEQREVYFTTVTPVIFELEVELEPCEFENAGLISVNIDREYPDVSNEFSLDGDNYQSSSLFTDLNPGDYTVFVQNSAGCLDSTNIVVPSNQSIAVTLPADTSVLISCPITINSTLANSNFIDSFYWTSSQPLDSNLTSSSITVRPTTTTDYTLTVIAQDGCMVSDDIRITVSTPELYVPNVFSPNQDGINDRFYPQTVDKDVYRIRRFHIYDRWGSLVYDAQDFRPNDPTIGWDGIHKALEPISGVYVWVVEYELIDGTTGMLSGDVTLIR